MILLHQDSDLRSLLGKKPIIRKRRGLEEIPENPPAGLQPQDVSQIGVHALVSILIA